MLLEALVPLRGRFQSSFRCVTGFLVCRAKIEKKESHSIVFRRQMKWNLDAINTLRVVLKIKAQIVFDFVFDCQP